jgi:hypothetical protein
MRLPAIVPLNAGGWAMKFREAGRAVAGALAIGDPDGNSRALEQRERWESTNGAASLSA